MRTVESIAPVAWYRERLEAQERVAEAAVPKAWRRALLAAW